MHYLGRTLKEENPHFQAAACYFTFHSLNLPESRKWHASIYNIRQKGSRLIILLYSLDCLPTASHPLLARKSLTSP